MKTRKLYYEFFGEPTTPYRKIQKYLNETLHVFNRDNEYYNTEIKKCYNNCITDLYSNYNKNYKIFRNSSNYYVQYIIDDIFPKIKQCQILIGIDKNNYDEDLINAVNIAFPVDTNIEGLLIPLHKLYKENKQEIELCTIIITLPNLGYKKLYNNDKYISTIQHELMHIFHQIIKEKLSVNAGDAYYYASLLCQEYNLNFPNAFGLDGLCEKDQLEKKYQAYLIAACIYYLDKSEQSAWIQSFNSYDKQILKNFTNNHNLLMRDPYKIYYSIYTLLNNYTNSLYKFNNNLLEEYFQSLGIIYNGNLKNQINK